MEELIIGEKIKIRPAAINDKRKVFEWLTNSNLTKEMMGLPYFPDAIIPTWEVFDKDYLDFYFDGSTPLKGRCFIILEVENEVGQINYNAIDKVKKCTDLDIWLSDVKYTGRGFGTKVILLLCEYLNERFDCEQIIMSPSKRNKNAIKSYEKAGFVMTDIELSESEKDYNDNVVMIKNMKK
ncbi:MAG: GNAT family N-acetyltransferase [Bacteroidota bacterium]